MHKNNHIEIHEITRVEGHGNIVINIKNGRIEELKFEIIESPRFFEALIRGRRYDETQHIMSRICGICAISHTSASLKAIEAAMGIKISPQSRLLRELAFCGETLQSHILHLYFLVMPDFFNFGSIVPLIKTRPQAAKIGLKLKTLANEISKTVCGRYVHPISLWPGGVTHAPKPDELKNLKQELLTSFSSLEKTLKIFLEHPPRAFNKKREFISLKAPNDYAFYDGIAFSNVSSRIKSAEYADMVTEYVVPHSTAKHSKTKRGTFMVGALARINNSHKNLKKRAAEALKRIGFELPCYNPFMNNHAQLVECFHVTEYAVELIDNLLSMGPKPEELKKPKKYGRGIGLVEAPRGILYHAYTINKRGIVEKANCIIPTAQNLRSIEEDLMEFVPTILANDMPKKKIIRAIEMLVRSYDPCISCSTHIMNVKFV